LREAEEYYRRRGVSYFVTEYIDGDENFSYAALVNRGNVKAFFMYREKREYPLTGGCASFATSSYDARVKEQCEKILRDLNWSGVAMMEFKIGTDHEVYFMELNPKFWASLELAVVSGVNFPALLIRMARGENVGQPPYKIGVSFRWILEDTLHFLSRPEKGIFNHLEPSLVDIHLDDLPAHIVRMVGELHRAATSGSRLGYTYGMPITIESVHSRVR
jgi:biotin carboxylase